MQTSTRLRPILLLILCFWIPLLHAGTANLTWEEAKSRANLISNVDYRLDLSVAEGESAYSGEAKVGFDLAQIPETLYLDFQGDKLSALVVNGTPIEPIDHRENRLFITAANLKIGCNQVLVHYTNQYNNDGAGLYKFVDTGDEREYVFTFFEPFDANRLFPSFDQPDIKPSYQVNVRTPSARPRFHLFKL